MRNKYKISAATLGVLLAGSVLWLNQEDKSVKHYSMAENTFKHHSLTKTTLAVTPNPKIVRLEENNELNVKIAPGYGDKFRNGHDAFFNWLENSFSQLKGNEIKLNVFLRQNAALPDSVNSLLEHNEAYFLGFKSDQITVVGHDTLGVLNGLTTLKKYLELKEGSISEGYIIDWPDLKMRAFHFVARGVPQEQALNLLKGVRENQFNTLVIQLADGVRLRGTNISARRDAWSEEFLQKLSKQAREFGIQFIPEIKLLSHQEKFFKKSHPNLMYNSQTYDPTKLRTKKIVKSYINRIIDLINPQIIHIGHDEVRGISKSHPNSNNSKKLKDKEKPLPANIFKESILFLRSYLKGKGVDVWMWGDMFLERDAYPNMFKWSNHGNESYAQLIETLPKDIIICDWHYWDRQREYPSIDFFVNNGFKVIGASWDKEKNIQNFSSYVANIKENKLGMIATTWSDVQKENWQKIDKILTVSSENFWNAK